MTCAIISIPRFLNYKVLEGDDTGVGSESKRILQETESLVDDYFLPFSRLWANSDIKFLTLKTKWETETAILSSVIEKATHPAYQEIIGMGEDVISLILSEMKKKPGHWFWALKSITGEDPVLPEHRGNIIEMTKAWLNWGKKEKYIYE